MPRKDYQARLEYNRQYRAKNREKAREWDRQNYERHREQRIASARTYYAEKREEMQAWQRDYNRSLPREDRAAYQAGYYQETAEQQREAARRWREANPEKVRDQGRVKRARKKDAPVCDLTRTEWERIKRAYDFRCAYCGKRPKRLTQDHVIPLSRGGPHTAENIVPACARCNYRKHAGPAPPFVVVPDWGTDA